MEKSKQNEEEPGDDSQRNADYDRRARQRDAKKAKNPDGQKAIFSSTLEQSIIPDVKANPATPDQEFEVEYVYGYRAFDCRQNLKYTSTGKAAFMAAALGVVLDPQTNTMKVYGG